MKKWLEKKGHHPPKGDSITRQMHKLFWNLPEELQQNFAKKLPQDLVDSVLRKVKTARAAGGSSDLLIVINGEDDCQKRVSS